MKLYYSKGACSLAIRIIIHELGLTSQFESVNLKDKKTETGADFLKINPKGYVPALEVEGHQILTENLAIQMYLADTHHAGKLLPLLGDFKRYQVLEWSLFISTEIHKGFGAIFNPNVDEKIKNELFIPLLKKRFSYIDTQLGQKKFLMGNEFTLPDAFLFVMLLWAQKIQLDITSSTQLTRYLKDLKNHPSIRQSLEEEQLQ